MKTLLEQLPGYRLNEYQLVLVPHIELRERILKVRKEFAEKFMLNHSVHQRPHILLAKFQQYASLESGILNRLNIIAMGYHPVKIDLKDYGSFPTHTIYINVQTKIPVQELVKEIRHSAQRLLRADKEHTPHFIHEPYITIATKLLPWQYEKGWLEYSHRHFTASFIADGMLLLRRAPDENHYQVVGRFEFKNLLVDTKQGELF